MLKQLYFHWAISSPITDLNIKRNLITRRALQMNESFKETKMKREDIKMKSVFVTHLKMTIKDD